MKPHTENSLRGDRGYQRVVFTLFVIFFVVNAAFLHRMPGLLGDEGSEGENVYQILDTGITAVGERSYIGPFIDYARIPFIYIFGYSVLALRVPVFIVSLLVFWLAERMFRLMFGKTVAVYGLTALVFSPIYILYQRLGWAITLFPFFALLLVNVLLLAHRYKWIVAGIVAGVGLANHIVFLPTLAGVAVAAGACFFLDVKNVWSKDMVRQLGWNLLLGVIGFWAGFGMQAAVLLLKTDDQGDPDAVAQLFSDRVNSFFDFWPLYISGSSYIARYVGVEMTSFAMQVLAWSIVVLAVLAVALLGKQRWIWMWGIALSVHTYVLLYMIDRFTLRYFVVFSLIIWAMAGLGLGALLQKLPMQQKFARWGSVGLAGLLLLWMAVAVFFPFLRTGGSVADFSLGDRTNSAAAFVDVRPLVACLRGAGPVHSENVHIWNRLQYLSHEYEDLLVLSDEQMTDAKWVIHMRQPDAPGGVSAGDICPELTHFKVVSGSV